MRTTTLNSLSCGVILLSLCLAGILPFATRQAIGVENQTTGGANSQQELNRLLTARYETATRLLEIEEKRLGQGMTTLARVCEAARWVRDSAVELPVPAEERVAALAQYVTVTRRLEESVERAAEQGAAPPSDREAARYLRLDAEIALLRARGFRQSSR